MKLAAFAISKAAKHPREFLKPLVALNSPHRCPRTIALHHKVRLCVGGNLWKVGDTEELSANTQRGQLLPHGKGCRSSDTRIHLVEGKKRGVADTGREA